MKFLIVLVTFSAITLSSLFNANAEVILSGSALVQFDTTALATFTGLTPSRFYGTGSQVDSATGTDVTAGSGGGAAIAPAPLVNLTHNINVGLVTNPTGRARQSSNADIDRLSPLSTWTTGEQIGIDGIARFDVFPSGIFVLGDYSLTYDSGTLSLNNNFQFPGEAFRVLSPTVTTTPNGFTLEGDLLTGTGLFAGFGIPLNSDIGFFSLNAVTAVPEPSSAMLFGFGAFSLLRLRRRRSTSSV